MNKNIIFDFGGVILNIDYNLTINAFKKLGINNFDTLYSQARQSHLFDKFEKGEISPGEFRTQINTFLTKKLKNEEINSAWSAMLLNLPTARLTFLEKLGKKHRLFLLSNTNEIHIAEFTKRMKKENQYSLWEKIFEKKYFSSKIGMRKPDAVTFEHVLNSNRLKANETLFVDDSLENIEGANRVGLNTYLLKKGEDILSLKY